MEASVMSDKQLMELAQVPPEDYGAPPHWWLRANRRIAQAQAEISLKAGIKEVIDYIKDNVTLPYPVGSIGYINWQSKLKEWGY